MQLAWFPRPERSFRILSAALVAAALTFVPRASAQYEGFGKNKVHYSEFDWRILAGEHIDLYYYPEEDEIAYLALKEAEEVYSELSFKFNHHVFRRVPLIIFSAHQYFEQSNTTEGFISEGVGGYTEFLKGRVVLPFNGSFQDFRHVLRHEMVHVFEISKANEAYRTHPRKNKAHFPLWWTEGLAEYFSTHWNTEADMYMRDLVLSDRVPPIEHIDLLGGGIIYKLGESIFHLLGERYGDEMLIRMYEDLWEFSDFDDLFQYVYGISFEQFGLVWQNSLKKRYYNDLVKNDEMLVAGITKVATKSYANIHPAVYRNPKNGEQRVAFVSPRTGYMDIYSVRLAKGEKNRKKHVRGGRSAEFESFHPLQTRMDANDLGQLLFVSKFNEKDALFIYDLQHNKKIKRFIFKGLVGISSPAWGPENKSIVFSGLNVSGFSDIYVFDLESEHLTRITNDRYADEYPDFSPDGRYIVFCSDRTVYGEKGYKNLFLYDRENGNLTYLTRGNWDDTQPRFSANGDRIAFVSDRGGMPNIFAINLQGDGGQLTKFYNGMLGFDWARADSGFCFTALHEQTYGIYFIPLPDSLIDSLSLDKKTLAQQWEWRDYKEHPKGEKTERKPYKRDYTLDFAYASVGYDPTPYYAGTFGSGLLMFSDLMGDNLFLISAGNSATSTDNFWDSFSGSVAYYNRSSRVNYGYGAFRFAGSFVDFRTDEFFIERDNGVYGLLSYPLSKYYRIETSMGFLKSYRDDFYLNLLRDSWLVTNSVAFIKDTSIFTEFGPVDGERWNLAMSLSSDISKGRTDNISMLLDLRKYFRLTTFSAFAVRLQGRFSGGKIPYRYVMGGSWTLRGYPRWSIIGSRSILLNQELRFPLYRQIDIWFPFGRIPLPGIEGAMFMDMGNAWEKGYKYPGLLGSVGVGFRMSLGGALVLRLDRARRLNLLHEGDPALFRDKYYTNFFFGYDY